VGGLTGPWGAALKTLASAPRDLKEAKNKALLQEAEFFRTQIVTGLREQEPGGKKFKPLSETTIALRKFFGFKGTKALLRNGYLRNSIAVVTVSDGVVFCGVLRTAKAANGESLVDIARLNEEGSKPIVIKMTPKMAALLHAAFRAFGSNMKSNSFPRQSSTGVIVVQIPARPFMMPVFEKFGQPDEASKRFAERVQKLMKGKGPWVALKGTL
jgi:hypothetical protein